MDKLEIGTNNPLVLKQCSILASTHESVNGVVIVWNPAQATHLDETMASTMELINGEEIIWNHLQAISLDETLILSLHPILKRKLWKWRWGNLTYSSIIRSIFYTFSLLALSFYYNFEISNLQKHLHFCYIFINYFSPYVSELFPFLLTFIFLLFSPTIDN